MHTHTHIYIYIYTYVYVYTYLYICTGLCVKMEIRLYKSIQGLGFPIN